ncbi:MAG: type II toxin-antitoxin system VapC family toxin [Candidatus Desantisbacteria bacterium]
MNKYVLDTSALFTYLDNEEGVEKIDALLLQALDGKIELFISIVSCIEVFYISLREQGDKIANERLDLVAQLPLKQQSLTHHLMKIIGEIKANNSMSFADCCIAGLARFNEAILVHKDPEFEQVKNIGQLKLPYKQKKLFSEYSL